MHGNDFVQIPEGKSVRNVIILENHTLNVNVRIQLETYEVKRYCEELRVKFSLIVAMKVYF